MTEGAKCSRRGFITLCASAVAAFAARPGLIHGGERAIHEYDRTRLVNDHGEPLRVAQLESGRNYIFHYPYITTPCFLLDLGEPANGTGRLETEGGTAYEWHGGVGPRRSVVAFSAICAHKMTHPARAVSFISYRDEPTTFTDNRQQERTQKGVIYCCSENSVYDPSRGAQVLGGPAPQPLAAVILAYDPQTDGLYATGIQGGELFERFFDEFGFRLALEYGTEDIQRRIGTSTPTVTLEEFSEAKVQC